MKQPALLFLIALLALSCTKESVRTAWSNQEASIDRFVKSQSGEAVYRGGSVRVILQAGTPEQLAADEDVRTKYLGSGFVLKRSKSVERARQEVEKEHHI